MFWAPLKNTNGYNQKSLDEVCTLITDGAHYSPKHDSQGKHPMLSVKDMGYDDFVYNDCKYISDEDFASLQSIGCQPIKNDVLVAKDGSYFKFAFVVKETRQEVILSSIAILRPDNNICLSEFVKHYLLTDEIYDLVKNEFITGMGLKRVILDDIKQIPIFIPPLDTQHKFVNFIKSYDKLKFEPYSSPLQSRFYFVLNSAQDPSNRKRQIHRV